MIIIKIGGSLYDSPFLKEWLDSLASIENQQIIIVPGGGPFADQVRSATEQWKIDEIPAHYMAVMAMQQYAYLLSSLNDKITLLHSFEDFSKNTSDSCLMMWLPYNDVAHKCDFPENWQTTSDSLAVWLADTIKAQKLCVVKCADLGNKSYQEIIDLNIVDEYFSQASKHYQGEIVFYHSSQVKKLICDIKND